MKACLLSADSADGGTLGSFIGGPLSSSWRKRYEGRVNQIWVDLCSSDPLAISFCQTFLKAYVRLGKVTRLTLGPEEVIEEQALKSADSLNSFRKTLIAEADDSIFAAHAKRKPVQRQQPAHQASEEVGWRQR